MKFLLRLLPNSWDPLNVGHSNGSQSKCIFLHSYCKQKQTELVHQKLDVEADFVSPGLGWAGLLQKCRAERRL